MPPEPVLARMRSPTFTLVTPSPTALTTPDSSPPGEKGRGFGITGIVTGVLALGVTVLWVLVFNAASNEIDNYDWQEFEDINSDPSDGYCDMDRYLQDPDC